MYTAGMEHTAHNDHTHEHTDGCSHTAVKHQGHVDYLHDGHLHFVHGDHVDEHVVELSASNPDKCTETHACDGHDVSHKHSAGCGHEAVPHASHTDYLVRGHLHHAHESHCDDHGALSHA
jgi:hypothetical protein